MPEDDDKPSGNHPLADALRRAKEQLKPGIDAAKEQLKPSFDAAREQLRPSIDAAREQLKPSLDALRPGIAAAQVVLKPAARAAKAVAWDARRAVQPEKLHDEMNRALGLDARHEVRVGDITYRIARVGDDAFEARRADSNLLYGTFRCDGEGRVHNVSTAIPSADMRMLLDIADAAIRAGLAP